MTLNAMNVRSLALSCLYSHLLDCAWEVSAHKSSPADLSFIAIHGAAFAAVVHGMDGWLFFFCWLLFTRRNLSVSLSVIFVT